MSPALMAQALQSGTWLKGDGPQMRGALTAPSGLWLRVYGSMSRIALGYLTPSPYSDGEA